MKMILLTTSDSGTPFYVAPEQITTMYRHKDLTMITYAAFAGSGAWSVKETPEQIVALAGIKVVK